MGERKRFRVKDGNRFLEVVPHAKGWRFDWYDGVRRRSVTRKKRIDIVEAAEDILRDMGTGFVWASLPPGVRAWHQELEDLVGSDRDRRALLDFARVRLQSIEVAQAVERWLDAKVMAAGEETPYLRDLRASMRRFSEAMESRKVAEVDFERLQAYLTARTAGKSVKFYIDQRAQLVEFWKWCRREDLTDGQAVTPAERLPTAKRERMERRVASSAELVAVLNSVGRPWRAWVVLGAWAGLRPEEIAPKGGRKKKHKRGLHCEDIDWAFGVLRVPADVSKIGRPRVVPMCAVLRDGLKWAGIGPGMRGPVVLKNPSECKETLRLGRLVFDGRWPKDILRHSFGSYRNAEIRNLPKVAEEMGTSEAMLHAHYHNPRAEAEAAEWFGLVRRSSQIWEVPAASSDDSQPAKGRKLKGAS